MESFCSNHASLERIHIEVPDDYCAEVSDFSFCSFNMPCQSCAKESLVFIALMHLARQMNDYEDHINASRER